MVSEDDTWNLAKPLHKKTNLSSFFLSIFIFLYIPIFMISKNIGAVAAAPIPTPMIEKLYKKSSVAWLKNLLLFFGQNKCFKSKRK